MMELLSEVCDCGWLISLALLGLLCLLIYIYGTWTFSTWTQCGVPGPKPQPFVGNVGEFRKLGGFNAALQWSKQYGKTFGIYFMRQPALMTTDLDIIKEVFIKDFNNFVERPVSNPLMPYPLNLGLVFVLGEQWRRLRHTMTPTFSSSKLKMMSHFISRCCGNLAESIGKSADAGKALETKDVFGAFTLDVIAGTGFGFDTNSLVVEDNVFLKHAKEVFGKANPFQLVAVIVQLFPSLAPLLKALGFSTNPKESVNFLTETIRTVVDQRKQGGEFGKDFIQLMLDAEASDEEVAREPTKKHLTKDELIAQGLLFFVAGYDTTSTTLQFLSYLLAMNPDKQDKLYEEIVAAVGEEEPSYENVMAITYLESCILETLRLFPPIPVTLRKCVEERSIQGVTIPAGCLVMGSIIGIMRDECFFPQPESYLPERYQDEDHPIPQLVREMAFGVGPRQCIAMRLALYEIKMSMVAVIRKFRLVKVEQTPEKITLVPVGLTAPSTPIYIGAERR